MLVDDPISRFWSNGRDLKESSKYEAAVKILLGELKLDLEDSSPTRQAIENQESWEAVARTARNEGLEELAIILGGA
ncbi:MAG: hypothetical protein G3M78_10495 [Candidatus Nitrohelix vancouverensis]|uniref:Uncharacterized protein n=1 Tax=Candidatus Nitrohelix vancouverensis TaxID=2705534 RepID=A0A7T0G3U5_9BACT|nr:MAG: hypothetical protein G3M78_10495 [Candidatus Nitrohelix vancouverensis]